MLPPPCGGGEKFYLFFFGIRLYNKNTNTLGEWWVIIMFKKLMVFLLVAMLLIPTTGALALEYLPQTTYAAFDSYQSGMLNGGYWNSTYEGYSLKWDAENGEYPDVLWRIYCSQDGLYEFVMNYITYSQTRLTVCILTMNFLQPMKCLVNG